MGEKRITPEPWQGRGIEWTTNKSFVDPGANMISEMVAHLGVGEVNRVPACYWRKVFELG